MDYNIDKGRMVSDRRTGVEAKESKTSWQVILVALAIIGAMYFYDQVFADKQQSIRQQEIKQLYWSWSYQPPAECREAMAEDNRRLCDEKMTKARAEFEAEWARRLASGWVPPNWENTQVSLQD